MSGAIGGVIDFNNLKINENIAENMIKALKKYKIDKVNSINRKNSLMVCGQIIITEENINEVLPYYKEDTNLFITADVILDNRKELFKEFNIIEEKQKITTDSELILMAYEKYGEECPKYLLGDFAFVIFDEKKEKVFCARDHMGGRTLYYNFQKGRFIFGTLTSLIFPLLHNKELNERWITDFLSLFGPMHNSEATETIYKEIYQLEPAHYMVITKNNIVKNKYWNPLKDVKPLKLKNHDEYVKRFLEIFEEAVKCRLRTVGQVGIMVSGGLDSGSIAAIASKELKKEEKVLKGYSFLPIESYSNKIVNHRIADESEYVNILKNYCGNLDITYCRNDNINSLTNIDELIGIFEQPIKTLENSYWVTGMAKQSSEDGVKVLLIGQNGNVSISFGDFFIHMQTLIRQLKFGEVISEVNAANKRYGKPKKAIYSTIISNAIPYKIKKIRHRKEDTIENKFEDSVIKLDLVKKYNVEERFDKKGYNSVITKVGTLKETRKSILDEATLAHIGIMETKDSLAYGIIKRDPSKDKRIMEFCLSIPSEAYVHEGEERYLIRSSMVGILPEEIRTNWRNRGIQSADWVERLLPDWDKTKNQVKEALMDNEVKKYVDIEKVEGLLEKYDDISNCQNRNEVKLILIPLVFYKFIKQYREMLNFQYDI